MLRKASLKNFQVLKKKTHTTREFTIIINAILQKGNSESHVMDTQKRYHKPIPLKNVITCGVEQNVIQHTDPQPGGIKIGQVARQVKEVSSRSSLAEAINDVCHNQSCVGILFDNFDGDVISNWGEPGAANAWQAYLRGFANLYCDSSVDKTVRRRRIAGDRVVFTGMIDADDLQRKALELAECKREVDVNVQLSAIVSEHSSRLLEIVKDMINSTLVSLFIVSGGDNAIYACSRAVKTDKNRVILLRIDRHMDERVTALRSDPSNDTQVFQHSGNGVTQAKAEKLVNYDFLLGCDFHRNNQQCTSNSDKYKDECSTSITSIEKMRFDPKVHIDIIIQEVANLLGGDDNLELIVNIDCDTFNGIPSSAETFTGGLEAKWAFYFLEKLSTLPRPPRIIRIAELHYAGDDVRLGIATDFAAEILRSGVKGIEKFYDDV